jgi:hypothetical protein
MEKTKTQSVSIPASSAYVFDFIADPETLPLWAVGFCRRIRRDGAGWIVTTSQGETPLRYETDRTRGTSDSTFHRRLASKSRPSRASYPTVTARSTCSSSFKHPGCPMPRSRRRCRRLARSCACSPASSARVPCARHDRTVARGAGRAREGRRSRGARGAGRRDSSRRVQPCRPDALASERRRRRDAGDSVADRHEARDLPWRSAFRTWSFRVATNHLRNVRRSQAEREALTFDASGRMSTRG